MSPRVTLPAGVEPGVAGPLIDVPGPVEVLGVDWPQRPVLCIQPMTAGDARFAEGRRAGLLEAAAHVAEAARDAKATSVFGTAVDGLLIRSWRHLAAELQEKAGAP